MKCMNYVMATTILKAWPMMEALMINIKDGKNEFFWFSKKSHFSVCVSVSLIGFLLNRIKSEEIKNKIVEDK